jgi:hypothetical protein
MSDNGNFNFKKEDALIQSIDHVLKLVDEKWNTETNSSIIFQIEKNSTLSYKNLEFLAISLYYQLTFLEQKYNMTFYTINMDYLFCVKRDQQIKAFVYGYCYDDELIDTIVSFFPDTEIATRYYYLADGLSWKETIDPTLLLYSGLPIRFHYKTIYYSVAYIIEKLFGRELSLIAGTKLDGFIKRAKNKNIQQRVLAL